MRRLLYFALGASKTSFRIDDERCRKTILTTRWEPNSAWLMNTSLRRVYGRGFEEAVTKSSAEHIPTTSHHRVLSNISGDKHLIVQYQVDACACKCGCAAFGYAKTVLIDEIVASSKGQEAHGADAALRVVHAGTQHSSACLVEIKSRDVKNTDMDDIVAQLWLSGQTNLYLARY